MSLKVQRICSLSSWLFLGCWGRCWACAQKTPWQLMLGAVPAAVIAAHAYLHVRRQITWIQLSPLQYQGSSSEVLSAALAVGRVGSSCPLCR